MIRVVQTSRSAWRIRRWEGAILLIFYAVYAALLYFVLA